MHIRYAQVVIVLLALATSCPAQIQFDNLEKSGTNGEMIVVTFSINDDNPDHLYLVTLYSSADNYSSPLKLVSGDVGKKISPGKSKRIEWRCKEELGTFKGTINFELRVTVTNLALTITGFDAAKKFRKGKTYEVRWDGGLPSDMINLDVMQGSTRISGYTSIANTGSHSFTIPKKAKAAHDYRIILSNTNAPSRKAETGNFEVTKRHFKPWYAAVGVAVVGTVIILLIDDDKKQGIQLPPLPTRE